MEQQRHQTGEVVNASYSNQMMFGYSHCNTDEFQHFKVPVFREIYYIAPSEQNRMIKTLERL
jgi:hypothetical protein